MPLTNVKRQPCQAEAAMLPVNGLSQKGIKHPVKTFGGRRSIPPMIPVSLGLPCLLLTPLAMAADPSEADDEGGCVETVEGTRIRYAGSCYITPSWVTGSSLKLEEGIVWGTLADPETVNLVSGKVRAFNFSRERDVKIVVQRGDYLVAAYPGSVSEVTFEDGREVVVFSREGDTSLNVSYESEPRTLEPGQGIIVGLVPDEESSQMGCSVRTTSVPRGVRTVSAVQRVLPEKLSGGWYALLCGIVLVYIVRRRGEHDETGTRR